MLVIATMIAAFVLTYSFLKDRQHSCAQLHEPRTTLATVGIQIVCGDCSGESESPAKTYLSRSGNCDRCGGSSFILASDLALYALQARMAYRQPSKRLPDRGRVLPFESPAYRVNRTSKPVAVPLTGTGS